MTSVKFSAFRMDLSQNQQLDRHLSLNEEDRNKLLESAIPQNTKNATKHWVRVINGYLKEKKIANSIDEILDVDLP